MSRLAWNFTGLLHYLACEYFFFENEKTAVPKTIRRQLSRVSKMNPTAVRAEATCDFAFA